MLREVTLSPPPKILTVDLADRVAAGLKKRFGDQFQFGSIRLEDIDKSIIQGRGCAAIFVDLTDFKFRSYRIIEGLMADPLSRYSLVYGMGEPDDDFEGQFLFESGMDDHIPCEFEKGDFSLDSLQKIQQVSFAIEGRAKLIPQLASLETELSKHLSQVQIGPAMDSVRQMMEVDHRCRRFQYLIGRFLEHKKEFDAAENHYNALRDLDPENPKLMAIWATFLASQKKFRDAVPVFQQCQKASGPFLDLLLATGVVNAVDGGNLLHGLSVRCGGRKFAAKFYQSHAKALVKCGKVNTCLKYLKKSEQETRFHEVKSAIFLSMGMISLAMKKNDKAIEYLKRSVAFSATEGAAKAAKDQLEKLGVAKPPQVGVAIQNENEDGYKPPADEAALSAKAKPRADTGEVELDIPLPEEMTSGGLIRFVEKTFEAEAKAIKEALALSHDQYSGHYIIFHPDMGGGTSLVNLLKQIGCGRVESFYKFDDVFERIRTHKIDCLVVWCEPSQTVSYELLRQLLEAREVEQFPVLAVCPGEQAIKELIQNGRDLFIDHVTVFARNTDRYVEALSKTLVNFENERMAHAILNRLREPWMMGVPKERRIPMTDDDIRSLAEPLISLPGKEYWVRAEIVLHALLRKEKEEAYQAALKLKMDHPQSFDAQVILSSAKARLGSMKDELAQLVEKVIQDTTLNSERYYRLGRALARSKVTNELGMLLKHWYSKDRSAVEHHQFMFLASSYFQLKNDRNSERIFLFAAVEKAPLRAEYLEAFGLHLQRAKDFNKAADLWRVAIKAYRVDKVLCRLGLVECLALSRRKRQAEQVLHELLNESPENMQALALQEKYFGKLAG